MSDTTRTCSKCKGTGAHWAGRCYPCNGTGRIIVRSAADRAAEAAELEASHLAAVEREAASPRGIRTAERAARQALRREAESSERDLTTSNGITYAATRGARGFGWFVTASRPLPSSYCRVVAGPYTSEAGALDRAAELAVAHELELRRAV